jgi:hypothetical protein
MHEILAVMWLLAQDSQVASILHRDWFLGLSVVVERIIPPIEGQDMFCSTATL